MRSFVLFLFLFAASCVTTTYGAFMSESSAGSIIIRDTGDISCGGLICPKGTVKCKLIKKEIPGTQTLEFHRLCLDQAGTAVASDRLIDLSPYPGFKATAEADIYGNYNVNGADMSPQAQAELHRKITENINNQMQHMQQSMNNMFSGMNNMFRNMFQGF